MGINFHVHWTLRTIRTRIKAAKNARQNASNNPLDSAGHWSKIGAFAKKPLVLHINAAAMMSNRPRHNGDKYVESVALSAEGIIEEDLRKSRMTYGKDSRINRAAVFSTQTERSVAFDDPRYPIQSGTRIGKNASLSDRGRHTLM